MLKGVRQVQRDIGENLNHTLSIEKGDKGQITFVQIDSRIQADIYEKMTTGIQNELKHLEDKRVGITLGQILQSSMFAHYGPDIPVQIWPKGATKVSLVPRLESQGINMVMVSLTAEVHNAMGVVIPFSEDEIMVDFEYPLAQALVVGGVPDYYFYNDQGQIKKGSTQPVTPSPPAPVIPSLGEKKS